MIVEQGGRRRLATGFYCFKKLGKPTYYLVFLKRRHGWLHLPEKYGGKLGLSFSPRGMVTWEGRPIRFRRVSWRGLPSDATRAAFLRCILHVERCGDPVDNDESVFGY